MATPKRKIDGVRTTSHAYQEMKERWALLYDLLGGTKTMRERGKMWLPQEPKESDGQYKSRLNRTFLFNAYKRTIESNIGNAFSRDITIENLPPELEYLNWNADGAGQNITSVAATLCWHLLVTGKAHPLVDFPETGGIVTVGELRRGEKVPFINAIDPRDLIGWRTTYGNGRETVNEIRFIERTIEFADEFVDEEVERVRLIREDEFLVHEQHIPQGPRVQNGVAQPDEPEWQVIREGQNTLRKVPIVQIYAEKVNTFVAYPPLEDLAWLNLRHWQSSSDQNNILHVVRVPLMFGKGIDVDTIDIGANQAIMTENEMADLKYVEHTGQAIGAGRQDLIDLENRMRAMGSDILETRSVSRQTATARSLDHQETLSTFQVILRNLESGLEQAIKLCGEWINVDASDVKVIISTRQDENKPITDLNSTETEENQDEIEENTEPSETEED